MADKISSADDLKIYEDNKNIRVFAGPGAGKTHLLIENIKHIIQKSTKLKENNQRKILCITYTNAAVEEIYKRLGSYSKYVVVSTVHSFINEYIISPFQKQLKLLIQDKFDINISENIKISSRQEGFSVLSGHNKEDIYSYIKKKQPEIAESIYNTISRSKMCDIKINISVINSYPFTDDVEVPLEGFKDCPDALKKIIKEYIWGVAGKLDFDEILYFGLALIKNYPIIIYMLQAEFPYILMDEYQDTNPIQNQILSLISTKEVTVAVVGDIAQSIFSFQGATYKEFQNFTLQSLKPIETKDIEDNRRSSQAIINLINFIRIKVDTQFTQNCAKNFKNEEKVTFLIQKGSSLSKSLNELIIPGTAIICRKWAEAFNYIDNVNEEQKKLINNIYNAYTYSAHRDLSQEIDAKKEAWISSAIDIAGLELCFKNKNIPGAMKILEKYLDIKDILKDFEKNKLQKFQKIIEKWELSFNTNLDDEKLKIVVEKLNKELLNIEDVTILENLKYPSLGEEAYFEAVYKHVDNLEIGSAKKIVLELFADESRHMTIHKAKGKEFNSVLVNLEPFSGKTSVEKDYKPSEIFASVQNVISENESYNEYLRIAYVACSRAINKLYIHLRGDEQSAKKIKETLNLYYEKNPEKQDFFDFVFC